MEQLFHIPNMLLIHKEQNHMVASFDHCVVVGDDYFFVVTQLASKHGIKVQLRHSWYGGITALVLLPRQLLANQAVPATSGDGGVVAERIADPELDWAGSRVPMVHVPLGGRSSR